MHLCWLVIPRLHSLCRGRNSIRRLYVLVCFVSCTKHVRGLRQLLGVPLFIALSLSVSPHVEFVLPVEPERVFASRVLPLPGDEPLALLDGLGHAVGLEEECLVTKG